MTTSVIISIQTDEHQLLSTQLAEDSEKNPKTNWQFSAEGLSTGSLVELLLHLESLGFETDK
ncbi:hypothetical protein [Spirosoma foliorum]|uniref:Uncharacterized protein n=1 Tax=Spirosoma foliorum TaxID=2710596 RepID=A0A7G5GRE6_9BACT|nr:hypothetical protein [Spirosoma foliorum]QMW01438.1 hypothetical protein H3H32_26270 [Spirosoma foliorum]